MKNLINSEIYKCLKSKSFKVCTIVGCFLALFTVVTFLLLSVAMNMLDESMEDEYADSDDTFSEEQSDVSFSEEMKAEYEAMGLSEAEIAMMLGVYDGEMILSSSFSQTSLQLLVAIFIAIFVAGEFSNGTIKVIVSRGYSRAQIYWSKFISGIVAGNIMAIIIVAVATIFASILWGWHDPETGTMASAGKVLIFLLIQFALNTAITAMFVACSMIFKSLGIAIAVTIASYSFGSILFLLVDAVIKGIAGLIEYNVEKLPFMPSDVWIMQTVTNTSTFDLSNHDIILALSVSLAYTVLFTLVGLGSFCKRDIK